MRFFKRLLALCVILSPFYTQASTIANVGNSVVNEGEYTIEWRGAYGSTRGNARLNQRWRMRQHIDVGINDWFATRLVTAQDNANDGSFEHHMLSWENRFQLIERRDHGWDAGFRINLGKRDDDKTPHEIDVRLVAQVPFGKGDQWEFRHNTIMEHDIGAHSRHGMTLELRNRITRAIESPTFFDSMRIGGEILTNFDHLRDLQGFDSIDHHLGLLVRAKHTGALHYQLGYRTSFVDDEIDHSVRFFVGQRF